MRLYDSRTRTISDLTPRDGRISMYVCGITPYDVTHLGHAFTYLTFDVVRRYLESKGVTVRHVQNITDVDDDLIRKAREVGATPEALRDENVALFDQDMADLGALRPHAYPRASDEIDGMIRMIEKLVKDGQAYAANGDVYFDVSTFPRFGELSGYSRERMLAEYERQRMRSGPRNSLDFLLWQARQPDEPYWPTPWGEGRPGWHIECSAMALRHAGEQLDLHGGGGDLIFPHHESEIAQSESFTGIAPFVRTWAHAGMIRYQGEKMSKSLGNLVRVRHLLSDGHTPDAIRLSLLGIHYRESREWTADLMRVADEQGERLLTAAKGTTGTGEELDPAPFVARFETALDNDLDTPGAVDVLLSLAERLSAGAGSGWATGAAGRKLRDMAAILGLRLDSGLSSGK